MRCLALTALVLAASCTLSACGGSTPRDVGTPALVPGVRAAAPQPDSRSLVSLAGTIFDVRGGRFVLRTRNGRTGVAVSTYTVVSGKPHAGEYAQVVGRDARPVRARYVAIWRSRPQSISIAGRVVASNDIGFSIDRKGGSSRTLVVLSSSTKAPPSLAPGDVVSVNGVGTIARGIVATRVSLQPSSPSPSPSPSPTATPNPTPTPPTAPTPRPIVLFPGEVVGTDDMFAPPDGDTPSGGQGRQIDDIPCAPTMSENAYHVHVYVGIYVNGKQVAVPDQIGLHDPGPIIKGFTNTAQCYYYIHTHDASGMVHIESPSTAPIGSTLYALRNVLDVWGVAVDPNDVGPFTGPVRVYTGRAPLGTTTVSPTSYSPYTGDPNAIALYSHEAIWLEVGPPYYAPPYLPKVVFETEY